MNTKKRSEQKGIAALELMLVATILLMGIFTVIEIGRLFSFIGTLSEATRRGARAAVLCPPFGEARAAATNLAVFANPTVGGPSTLAGISQNNIRLEYLSNEDNDNNGELDPVVMPSSAPLSAADLVAACTNYAAIRFVRVSINPPADFSYPLAIPLVNYALSGVPEFATTLPIENLGFIPGQPNLQCFGIVNTQQCP